jgi:hypothetical protein
MHDGIPESTDWVSRLVISTRSRVDSAEVRIATSWSVVRAAQRRIDRAPRPRIDRPIGRLERHA